MELHITSLVVHAAPRRVQRVSAAIAEMAGAQVHAISPAGKLVVTIEAGSETGITSCVERIQRVDGVLSAVLVCQYADSVEAMMEEVP
jgi:nitrate reductase NapD